jgi:SpoIID/LytB domain protein
MRWAWLLALLATSAAADELSGADKLRVVYSTQFAWTRDGLPLVTVRVAEKQTQVTISGNLRVLPDGEGGASVAGGHRWTVRVDGAKPGKVRWHVVVARLPPDGDAVQASMKTWRERGFSPQRFEVGTVFAVRGAVFDSRRVLVTVAPHDDEAGARAAAAELSAKHKLDAGVHPELVERPRGTVIAVDERGTTVANDGILWFASDRASRAERGEAPPRSGVLTQVPREVAPSNDELLALGESKYAGKLYVTVENAGTLAVVNAVPEDRLLAGLVPAEMPVGAPPEALKAQAVAARNELLAKIGTRHLTDPYRLCSTVHCQVYAGAGREDPRATAAVAATRGELLLRDDGSGLVDAVYSASCGGHTEDNDRVWGGAPDPSLRGRFDEPDGALAAAEVDPLLDGAPRAFCARAKEAGSSFRWSKTIDLVAVAQKAGVGALRDVEILERGVSGRAARIRLVGDGGAREIRGELEVRRALGGLKSALFRLAAKKDAGGHLVELRADGGGHGHGIGMCQLGAVGMAEASKSYREILQFYYRAAHLQRVY